MRLAVSAFSFLIVNSSDAFSLMAPMMARKRIMTSRFCQDGKGKCQCALQTWALALLSAVATLARVL